MNCNNVLLSGVVPQVGSSFGGGATRGGIPRVMPVGRVQSGGSSYKIVIRNVSGYLVGFSRYYGPLPNSGVVNCVAHNRNISVRGHSYVGIPRGVTRDRRSRH